MPKNRTGLRAGARGDGDVKPEIAARVTAGGVMTALLAGISLAAFCQNAWAGGVQAHDRIPDIEVIGQSNDLIGTADTASEGTVLKEQLEERPVYRVGELLETVPGLIVTQHSGEGKANQYFLRGFNLDHGTDIAISVDDMPVNMRTHAHGQGYSDLNFMIPELVSNLQYKKGTYFAEEGEFATAGAVHVNYLDKLDHDLASFSMGTVMDDRAFGAVSRPVGSGNIIAAAEYSHLDGPWTIPDNFNKGNAVLRYSQGTPTEGFSVTGMYMKNDGHATNQVPLRAVKSGLIGLYDVIDPTDGVQTERYSLSGKFTHSTADGQLKANAYFIGYNFRIFNDFTFSQDFPAPINDQFKQQDHRHIYGGNVSYTSVDKLLGFDTQNTGGFQFRADDIHATLSRTTRQVERFIVRDDRVTEISGGFYFENRTQWLEKFRTVAGIREDIFYGTDASNLSLNSGTTAKGLFQPKGNLIFGPWANTEFYLSAGQGYHSNDVRGSVISISPTTGDPLGKTPLLTRATGYEVGVRSSIIPHLQLEAALFQLDIDSELTFSGDAGETTAGRPSRRQGVELSAFYTPRDWLIFDADFAFSRARFTTEDDGASDTLQPDGANLHRGSYIPGAAKIVASAGMTVTNLGPWEAGLRFRYFGPRPLSEDKAFASGPTTLVDARIGYKFTENLTGEVDIYNIFNSRAHQIDYAYPSQLSGEAAPVNDIHFHPVEPTSARFTLKMKF